MARKSIMRCNCGHWNSVPVNKIFLDARAKKMGGFAGDVSTAWENHINSHPFC